VQVGCVARLGVGLAVSILRFEDKQHGVSHRIVNFNVKVYVVEALM
jgi:hypothetical protein